MGVGGRPIPTIAAAARDMTNRPDEERGSVLSTAMSFLSIYRDPLIAKNVSRSDFRIADLMNHEKPVSLYLIVRAEDKDRMKPLMRLIINQLVRVLLRPEITYAGKAGHSMPHKHRLLLMLDEFPSYGKLEVFQEALAYIAGHGIKAYLIMQDIAQLWGAYGRDESVISNCHVRAAYAPNKIETADWLSRMTGTATIVKEDITTSRQPVQRRALQCLAHLSPDQPAARHARRGDAAQIASQGRNRRHHRARRHAGVRCRASADPGHPEPVFPGPGVLRARRDPGAARRSGHRSAAQTRPFRP